MVTRRVSEASHTVTRRVSEVATQQTEASARDFTSIRARSSGVRSPPRVLRDRIPRLVNPASCATAGVPLGSRRFSALPSPCACPAADKQCNKPAAPSNSSNHSGETVYPLISRFPRRERLPRRQARSVAKAPSQRPNAAAPPRWQIRKSRQTRSRSEHWPRKSGSPADNSAPLRG